MKLTSKAIQAINSKVPKLKLALALAFTEVWIDRLIAANKNNGPLTTAAALQIIAEETGLSNEEILEEDTQKVA